MKTSKKATEESLARAEKTFERLQEIRKEAEQKVADEHGKSALQDLDDEEDAAYEEKIDLVDFDYDYILAAGLFGATLLAIVIYLIRSKKQKEENKMTKIQRASIYLFLLFAGIGLEFELGHLSQQEFSQSAGRDLVLNLSVLAAIIIPLYLFSKRLAKQLSVPTYVLWIAMFGGAS